MPDSREKASAYRGYLVTACSKAGAQLVPWSQYTIGATEAYNKYVGEGLCHGLSMKYLLTAKAKGPDHFIEEVNRVALEGGSEAIKFIALNPPQEGGTLVEARPKQEPNTRLQQSISGSHRTGNGLGDGPGRIRVEVSDVNKAFTMGTIATEHRLNAVKTETFRLIAHFAEFVTKPGYYMIYVKGHTMCLVANGGTFRFFDPNTGIVSASSAEVLRKVITSYLDHRNMKVVYGNGMWIDFKVTRYA